MRVEETNACGHCGHAKAQHLPAKRTFLTCRVDGCRCGDFEHTWRCKALVTTDPPQDCGWPGCGCDPEPYRHVVDRVKERCAEHDCSLTPMCDKCVTDKENLREAFIAGWNAAPGGYHLALQRDRDPNAKFDEWEPIGNE
jgi:hypothetical protein